MSPLNLPRTTRLWVLALFPLLFGGCGTGSASPKPGSLLSSDTASRIHLPGDQAAHSSAENEWWYLVGHVHAGNRTFGYETTVFKFKNIRPPGLSTPISLFRTDVAITDEQAKQFHDHVTYYFPASAQVSDSSLSVRVGGSALTGASLSSMRLRSRLPGGSLDLHLASQRPAMDVGGSGYIGFGNGYTYYYSLTDIATHGTLRVGGRTYKVSGVSWLDHQWGNWSWTGIHGWTWMALQLNNGTQLSLFDVRGGKKVRLASVLPPNRHVETIQGIAISPLGTWRSPHTKGVYPSGWRVSIPAVHASLRIEPTVRDQELAVPSQAFGSYWEGSGRVTGTWMGKAVTGLSYTELTGYASHGSIGIPGGG